MASKIVDKVTVTGADDSIAPIELLHLAREFPFVEFGILVSKEQMGGKRFPSLRWMMELHEAMNHGNKPVLAGHVCGQWVRDMCVGRGGFFEDYAFWTGFSRLQLNFHAEPHRINLQRFAGLIQAKIAWPRQIIMQADGVNNHLFFSVKECPDIHFVPLFDLSGGTGELPVEWPKAIQRTYCGYTGGLSPENLAEQMERIAKVAGAEKIWIDVETHIRSQNDLLFDLKKVRQFLKAAQPWVIGY